MFPSILFWTYHQVKIVTKVAWVSKTNCSENYAKSKQTKNQKWRKQWKHGQRLASRKLSSISHEIIILPLKIRQTRFKILKDSGHGQRFQCSFTKIAVNIVSKIRAPKTEISMEFLKDSCTISVKLCQKCHQFMVRLKNRTRSLKPGRFFRKTEDFKN